MKIIITVFLMLSSLIGWSQNTVRYEISFDNRAYNEAEIQITMTHLPEGVLEMLMSRSSPGRYAIHEFAKNVYNVKAYDSKGNRLEISRPNPYQWNVAGHDHTVVLHYTLFANRADGTYSQFSNQHAHMNIPATFMYPKGLEKRPINLNIKVPAGSDWKVATQLRNDGNDNFYAPDLYYFMDSPIEASEFMLRSYQSQSGGKEYTIRMALHHSGSAEEADQYFEKVKKVVEAEKEVFSEFPDFDFGEYTFLACYEPGVSGDGMEHRNSTVITSTRSLNSGGMENNIGTVSHEFFHAWNVERIRPRALEPFDFQRANMSGELWFAEGFTSYYTNLILCRAGLISKDSYINGLKWTLNAVINGSGRNFFTPIEMSYRAPFVDAAQSIDPTNNGMIFISYYTYGNALGLALDLSLRSQDGELNLDGYMQLLWRKYGKNEIPYFVKDLESVLAEYAGEAFASAFFSQFIYDSKAPDYKSLLAKVGVTLDRVAKSRAWLGAEFQFSSKGWIMSDVPEYNGPSYMAHLEPGDVLTEINGISLLGAGLEEVLSQLNPQQDVRIKVNRADSMMEVSLKIGENPLLKTSLFEEEKIKINKEVLIRRNQWLGEN